MALRSPSTRLAAGTGRTDGGSDGAIPHWGPGSSCARLAEGALPLGPAGVNLAEGVAQRVLVRARAGARLSAVLAEVVAQRGGDCGAVALLPLAPRFGIDRVEVRQALPAATVADLCSTHCCGRTPSPQPPPPSNCIRVCLQSPLQTCAARTAVAHPHPPPL